MENYSKLNALQISRECLQMINETLEPAQAGEIIMALYQYFYEGIEPNFETKLMNGIWKTCLTFTQSKADAFMRQHRNFFNSEENPKTKKNDLSRSNCEAEQVTTEPAKVSQNEEKLPYMANLEANNTQSVFRKTFEERLGASACLLDGKDYNEALKLQTVQNMMQNGTITDQDLLRYFAEKSCFLEKKSVY